MVNRWKRSNRLWSLLHRITYLQSPLPERGYTIEQRTDHDEAINFSLETGGRITNLPVLRTTIQLKYHGPSSGRWPEVVDVHEVSQAFYLIRKDYGEAVLEKLSGAK